ncbi:MAG: NAD(P)/FAD-dependent oxidoreductase [bacterium]|jgi:flavin-dependent dehydrogenase|nr:NAD(P)/FAD-dependent oxidoreductase [Planctomycetota bacterium]HIL52282.1 NAD(P)/FAD-dependent oxidoreductase [Planctomycetota bacterium]
MNDEGTLSQGDIFDVVIIGGALSGSTLALLLRRWRPSTRILVVEAEAEFDRKVGEATVELSGFFLSHVCRLHDLLAREHLHKMGLRFWFSDGAGCSLAEMTEVSSELIPSLPSFQLDRARFDESLLGLCGAEGTEVERPARVQKVDLNWPRNRVEIKTAKGTRTVSARWVVDASGKRCVLGRQLGLIKHFEEHPTASAWGRWKSVADMDGAEVLGADVRAVSGLHSISASRRLCTNHFMGHGWWIWLIPLSGGETSIGIVYDKRLFQLPEGEGKQERYESFLRNCDGLGELLQGASLLEDDFRSYEQLAYCSLQYMDNGWALVGDAAAFLDPYYSPGLDHCATSVFATASLIDEDLKGGLSEDRRDQLVEEHNQSFVRSFTRSFEALYRDKYELFGDAELTAAAFYLDTAMYYLGVLAGPLRDVRKMAIPPFGRQVLGARMAASLMACCNRRLVKIARRRQKRGSYGRRNRGWRAMTENFGSAKKTLTRAHRKGLWLWLCIELRELRESLLGADNRRPE